MKFWMLALGSVVACAPAAESPVPAGSPHSPKATASVPTGPAIASAPPAVPTSTAAGPVAPCAKNADAMLRIKTSDGFNTFCTELEGRGYYVGWYMFAGETWAGNVRLARSENGVVTGESRSDTALMPGGGDKWTAEPAERIPGVPGGILVNIVASGTTDDDYVNKFAVIFREERGVERIDRVAIIDGGTEHRKAGACTEIVKRSFRFVDAATLEIATTTTGVFTAKPPMSDADLARAQSKCKPPSKAVTRMPIPR